MVASQTLLIELVAKVDNIEKGIGRLDSQVSGFGGTVGKVGKLIGGAFAVGQIVDFGKQAVEAFSTLEQSVGGVEAVFGEASETVLGFGRNAAESVGLAQSEYNTLSTSLGGLLKGAGITQDVEALAAETDNLIRVGADLAATYGGSTAQAVEALGSAFRGEADPAERFNLNLKASVVNAKAVELGLAASTSEVDAAAKATAIMALVQEQSTDALGQFGREADTVAGKQARLTAKWEDAQAEIGGALVPVVMALFGAFEPLIPVIVDIATETAPLIAEFAKLVPPIADLALALVPLLVSVLKPLIDLILPYLVDLVDEVSGALQILVGWIQKAVDWFAKIKIPNWLKDVGAFLGSGGIINPFGASTSRTVTTGLPSAAATFSTSRVGSTSAWSSGGLVASGGGNIIINTGVGDPVAIGREVVEAIRAYERTSGPAWRVA